MKQDLRGDADECNCTKVVEGRGRPGPDGICLAYGVDRIGRDCLHEDAWDDGQQRVFECRGELDNELTSAVGLKTTRLCGTLLVRSGGQTTRPHEAAICEETQMSATVRRLWKEEEGQDLTEYALLMVLIAMVAIASMKTLGTTVSNVFSNAAANLTTAS